MEYFRYTLQFLNTITFTSSTYTELDNFLNGVVKGYLNHNFGFLPIAPTEDELDELANEIGASYDLMLNDIKPRYEEVLRLGTVHTFRSKDTTKSEYGAENRTGKYYEPVVSNAQAEVKTNGENTTWGDDTTTLDREEDRVLSESAIKDFFKEIKEEVELYFIDYVNIYADGTGCQKSYTLEQLEAINSGITKSKVEQIQTNKENIDLLVDEVSGISDALDDKQDKLDTAQLDAVNSGIDSTKVGQIATNKNNIAQLSNQNLLINGDFKINQRGQNVYTLTGIPAYTRVYTVDRWKIVPQVNNSSSTVTVNSNSISIYCANQYDNISQNIENFSDFAGKTLTLSIKVKAVDTTNFVIRFNVDGTQYSYKSISSTGITTLTSTLPNTINSSLQASVVLANESAKNIEIEYIKLEIGEIATPFSPRPYAEELQMCLRYYWKSTASLSGNYYGWNNSTTIARFTIPLPAIMRTPPTISTIDLSSVNIVTNGSIFTPSAIAYQTYSNNKTTNVITFELTTSGLTLWQTCIVRILQEFSLDAEIY